MQQTLQTSRDQATFEEHRLRMYYLARYIATIGRSQSLLVANSNGEGITPSLYGVGTAPDLNENNVSVDGLLIDFASRQHLFQETVLASQIVVGDEAKNRNEKVRSTAQYILSEAESLIDSERYAKNPLIAARLKGIEFDWVLANIRSTVNVLFALPL